MSHPPPHPFPRTAALAAALTVLLTAGAPAAAAASSSSSPSPSSSKSASASARSSPTGSRSASPTPSASASNPRGTVTVTPGSARPGATVTVKATGCTGNAAIADSDALAATVPLARPASGPLSGSGQLASSAGPGTYTVTVTCAGGGTEKGSVTVLGAPSNSHVPTGGGGSVTGGFNPGVAGLGVVLVVGGAAYYARLRRGGAHDGRG